MHQLAIPLNNLPIQLVLLSSGQLAFVSRGTFRTIFDQPEQGISAVIRSDKMLVGNTEVLYNKKLNYKEMPELLQWLQQQNLEKPY